jgi:hypothetical protein
MIRIPAFMIPVVRTGETRSGIPLGRADEPGRRPGEDRMLDRSIKESAPIDVVFRAAHTAQGESFL